MDDDQWMMIMIHTTDLAKCKDSAHDSMAFVINAIWVTPEKESKFAHLVIFHLLAMESDGLKVKRANEKKQRKTCMKKRRADEEKRTKKQGVPERKARILAEKKTKEEIEKEESTPLICHRLRRVYHWLAEYKEKGGRCECLFGQIVKLGANVYVIARTATDGEPLVNEDLNQVQRLADEWAKKDHRCGELSVCVDCCHLLL
jgi:hypothetical protein